MTLQMTERQRASSQRDCENAIGKDFKIKIDRHNFITGIIISAHPHQWKLGGQREKLIYEIRMECGENKTIRHFFTDALPK